MAQLKKLYPRIYNGYPTRLCERIQKTYFSYNSDIISMENVSKKIGLKDEKKQNEETQNIETQTTEGVFNSQKPSTKQEPKSFASLLRNSTFVHLGPVEGSLVAGKIFEVQRGNAFVDFGGKFHCVCPIPEEDAQDYRRGRMVALQLFDLELSARFMGASKDITLLEADGKMVGLISEQFKTKQFS